MGESNSNNAPRDPVGGNDKDITENQQSGICLDIDEEDEKSHTFRRRRLSVPKHHLAEQDDTSRPVRHSNEHDKQNQQQKETTPDGSARKKLKTTSSSNHHVCQKGSSCRTLASCITKDAIQSSLVSFSLYSRTARYN